MAYTDVAVVAVVEGLPAGLHSHGFSLLVLKVSIERENVLAEQVSDMIIQ